MRRVLVDLARVARGAVASSSGFFTRVTDVPHLAVARRGLTAVQHAYASTRCMLPLLSLVSEHPRRSIATSAVLDAPRVASRSLKPNGAQACDTHDDELTHFVNNCCGDIGRGGDDDTVRSVVTALIGAGRASMKSLDGFTEADAMAAGVPLRLAVAMRRRIAGNAVANEQPGKQVRIDVPKVPPNTQHASVVTNDIAQEVQEVHSNKMAEPACSESNETEEIQFATLRAKAAATEASRRSRGMMPRSTRPDPTRGNSQRMRVRRKSEQNVKTSYRLSEDEMSDALRSEFKAFRRFLTVRRLGSIEAPIKEVTARKYEDQIRGLLGWMRSEFPEEFPTERLTSMRVAFPSLKKSAARFSFEHLQWLSEHRKCSAAYELVALRSFIAAAKFLHGSDDFESENNERPYANVPLVRQLRALNKDTGRRASKASPTADIKKKWLEWGTYLQVVKMLEDEVAPRWVDGGWRSETSIAWSVQRYLIFGILSCVPDRQRTIRELEVGKTLFKEFLDGDDGTEKDDRYAEEQLEQDTDLLTQESTSKAINLNTDRLNYPYRWVIKHGVDDYKTGKNYGERPPMVISPGLYGALEEWLEVRRAHLSPTHNFLFTSKNGQPLTDVGVHGLLTSTSYRLTGKRVNPHLIRDMIITHLRGTDASERQLEALAIYMGHSLAMQKGTYDRRSKAEKVAPAVELLSSLNSMGSGLNSHAGFA